jgi:selenocysteine lyase/cysteine desulfurase
VDGQTTWANDPQQRHEAGTPNVLGAIALAAAAAALSGAGWATLIAEEERLLTRLRRGLAAIPGLRELGLWDGASPRIGIVSFVLDGWNARELALTLSQEYGIGVRDGKFCAHPFVRHLLGDASAGCSADSGTAVRASIGVGTTDEQVDRLVAALGRLTGR